jgi:hypothetical protein
MGYYAALVTAFAMMLTSMRCVNMNAANTSEVGNPKLSGHLVDGRSGLAAQGATVRIYPVYLNRMARALGKTASGAPAIDSALTDPAGYYSFDSLDQNVYSIEGEYVDGSDTLTMRHPSVMVIKSMDLGYDTLRLPGWIKGNVVVPSGESPKNITCYIPGTSYIAITNDTGGFKITGIPEGAYSLSVTSARFNDTTLFGITVTPNHETDAGYIALGLDRSKNEHDVWGVFDSTYNCKAIDSIEAVVSGDSIPADKPRIYKLDWRPSLNGYSGFIYVPDNGFFWKVDIVVFDTLGRRIGLYRVPTINRASGDVEVANFNPFNSIPVISLHDTTVSINDTIRLRPVISILADDSIVSMEWKIGSAGTFTRTTNKDTIIVASKDSGIISGIFKVTDKFGNIASDTIIDSVITDPPVPAITIVPAYDSAGNSITLPLGTKISYKASVQQRFRSVAKITWSYQGASSWGNGGIQDSGSITFDQLGQQRLICRVRDDDGNEAADTLNVLVVTVIGGVLPMNSVLRESGSPYAVKQDLVVQTGGTLTIESGTLVRIDPGVNIIVYGAFYAEGTSSKRIVFMVNSNDTTSTCGGLNLQTGSTCKLKNCNATNGGISGDYNILYAPDSIILDSCTFKNNAVSSGHTMCGLIRGCVFLGNGVGLHDDSWKIEGNMFIGVDDFDFYSNILIVDGKNTTISSNRFTGGGTSLAVIGAGIINNNIIENSIRYGISVFSWGTGSWTISDNTIRNCMGTGLFADQDVGNPSIEEGKISHNLFTGIGFGASSLSPAYINAGIVCMGAPYSIDSNIVTNNSIGVICSSSDALTNNNIYNNRDYDFRVLVNDAGNVSAPNNWWGTADTATIQTKIFDYNDDNGLGKVLIDPIATDSIPGAGPR